MGYGSACDAVEYMPLDVALSWHLFSNHYPSLPKGCLEIAQSVIEHINDGGTTDKHFDISSIGEHRIHGTMVPAYEIIEAWHLEPFLTVFDYYEDEDDA